MISDEQGLKHTNQLKINSCFHSYYSSLYTSEPTIDETALDLFLHTIVIARIDRIDIELATELKNDITIAD